MEVVEEVVVLVLLVEMVEPVLLVGQVLSRRMVDWSRRPIRGCWRVVLWLWFGLRLRWNRLLVEAGFLIPVGEKNRNPPIKPIYREYRDFLFLFLFFLFFYLFFNLLFSIKNIHKINFGR